MIRKLFASQLRINMFSGIVVTVVNGAVLAVAYPVYLHFLGYEKYGVWLVLATVLGFAQLGNLGMGQAVMKLVSEEYGRGNIEAIQQYVTTAIVILMVSGLIALALILMLKTQIISIFKLTGDNAKIVMWLLPYVGGLTIYVFLVQILNDTLSGLGRMDLANYVRSIGRITAVCVSFFLLYSGQGIKSLLIANMLSYILIHVASVGFVWRIAPVRLLRLDNLSVHRCKHLLSFGGAVFGGSLIAILFDPFNKVMLSRYVGVSAIPVYEIAYKVGLQIRGLFQASLRPMIPEVSRLSGAVTLHAVERIRSINRRLMKYLMLSAFPLYVILLISAEWLLRIWLGGQYNDRIPLALRLSLVGTFFSLFGIPAYYTLLGLGRPSCSLVTSFILAGGNFIIVLTTALLTKHVSAKSIFVGLIFLFGLSTVYLLGKAYHETNILSTRPAIDSSEIPT